MHYSGGYPSRELARDQEAGVFALHLDRTLEGVEKLVHVMKVPGAIDIHTIDSGRIRKTYHMENWFAAMLQLRS